MAGLTMAVLVLAGALLLAAAVGTALSPELLGGIGVGALGVAGLLVARTRLDDIASERDELEDQLRHRAFHDDLTGLPNRYRFRDRVEHAVARATRREEDAFAVLCIDLDGFKAVNDTFGHVAGDRLLRTVGKRITSIVREVDTTARLGGDEFAVLLEYLGEDVDAARVAERIIETVSAPITMTDGEIDVGCSVGIALSEPGDRPPAEELLRNADIAMYMAKQSRGPGGYEIFEPEMHATVVERLEMEADLALALQEEQFELHYQPIVDLDSGRIEGVEALLRWRHPERGMTSPGEFIPLAEDTGLIVEIGAWVLQTGCDQLARWQRRFPGSEHLGLSVNVTSVQFERGDLMADVAGALENSGVDPSDLTLEITESGLLADTDRAMEVLGALKQLGTRLAVDDFGTGYSSLAYLHSFPFDVLKIDRSFIDGLTRGTRSPTVVRAIIDLGRSLDLETVAEGIEHAEQLARFRKLHCNKAQGYLFARPAPAAEIEQLLAGRGDGEPAALTPPARSARRSGRY